jgi:hypothetical protein
MSGFYLEDAAMTRGNSWLSFRLLALTLLIGAISIGSGADEKKEKKVAAKVDTGVTGIIDSLDPSGDIGMGPKDVTFIAKTSFRGEGFGPTAKPHAITLRLVVITADGDVKCNTKQDWDVPDAEHGCVKCPVSCTQTALDSGVYFINATLFDQPIGGKRVKLDTKSSAVIIE